MNKIVYNEKWCKMCYICAAFCPTHAIRIVDDKLAFSNTLCSGCKLCQHRCPDFAIDISADDGGDGA